MKNWTGERLETFVDLETTLEHLHRYAFAIEFTKDKKVIDIACGEGYGSNLLAKEALEVTGVDISTNTIEAAKKNYTKKNLNFLSGSILEIPCPDNYFDVAVSFETLEHISQHNEMLAELKRVLKEDGILIISTPDKLYYTDKSGMQNPHHIKELYENEFKNLLENHFTNCDYYYQKPAFSSIIIPEKGSLGFKEYNGGFEGISSKNTFNQLYIICVASLSNLSVEEPASAFTDSDFIRRQSHMNIEKVKNSVSYKIGHYLLLPLKILKRIVK